MVDPEYVSFLVDPILEDLSKEELHTLYRLARDQSVFDEWFENDPNKIDEDRVLIKEFDAEPAVERTIWLERLEDTLEYAVGLGGVDLIKGYVNYRGNLLRIGKILRKAKKPHEKNLFTYGYVDKYGGKFVDGEMEGINYENYQEHLQRMADDFEHREIVNPNDYWVIVSKSPVDILRMSEDRGWTSCTNIREATKAWYEIMCGGFIMYLVKKDVLRKNGIHPEQGIQDPTARIMIRKFMFINPATGDVRFKAMPEDEAYGEDTTNNLEGIARDWIKSKGQLGFETGIRDKMYGMAYSDAYGDDEEGDATVVKVAPYPEPPNSNEPWYIHFPLVFKDPSVFTILMTIVTGEKEEVKHFDIRFTYDNYKDREDEAKDIAQKTYRYREYRQREMEDVLDAPKGTSFTPREFLHAQGQSGLVTKLTSVLTSLDYATADLNKLYREEFASAFERTRDGEPPSGLTDFLNTIRHNYDFPNNFKALFYFTPIAHDEDAAFGGEHFYPKLGVPPDNTLYYVIVKDGEVVDYDDSVFTTSVLVNMF